MISEQENGFRLTYIVIAVREVETRHIHASVEHLDEHVDVPAGRAQCANDLGFALAELDLLEDVLESDAA